MQAEHVRAIISEQILSERESQENKEFAKLKKRIKRLGMYQTLIEGMQPRDAANFSRGKDWTELDVIMKERGF